MGTEITIARKRLSGIQAARLIVDRCPPDPRACGNSMTTIVAWHPSHSMSDTKIYGSPQEFREKVLDQLERNRAKQRPTLVTVYEHESHHLVNDLMDADKNNPGVIRTVYMHDRHRILLHTEEFHERWDSRHLGWVYITSRQMRDHSLSLEEAVKTINAELEELENYTNGTVYAILIERKGQHNEISGAIRSSRERSIDDNLLDEVLEEMNLNTNERRHAAQAAWEWL